MRRPGSLLCLVLLACTVAACDGVVVLISTGPLPPPIPSPTGQNLPPLRPLVLGEVVHSTFAGPVVSYNFVAPASGFIFVHLSWNRSHGPMQLTVADQVFTAGTGAQFSNGTEAAIVGRIRTTEGQQYVISVDDGSGANARAPIDFTLKASLD